MIAPLNYLRLKLLLSITMESPSWRKILILRIVMEKSRFRIGYFLSIWAREGPKRCKIFWNVQIIFKMSNFFLIYWKYSENQFPGKNRKFKFLNFKPFYEYLRGNQGRWFRIFLFQIIRFETKLPDGLNLTYIQ